VDRSPGAGAKFFHVSEEWLVFGGHEYPGTNEHAGFHCESEDMKKRKASQ